MKRWDDVETWVEEKGWKYVKKRLSDGYIWRMQAAKRRNKKGRVLVIGIKRDLFEGEEEKKEVEGIMARRIKVGRNRMMDVC